MMLKGVCAELSSDGSQILLKKDDRVIETLQLVAPEAQHRNFIISTWVKSYPRILRPGVSREVFNHGEGTLAEELWDSGLVAVSGDGFTIHGWVAGGSASHGGIYGKILEHCYVQPDLRRLGIAKCLIEAGGYSKQYARPLNKLKLEGWVYNPYR